MVTVAGVCVHRWRLPEIDRPDMTWGYPVTPLHVLAANAWVLVYVFLDRPTESRVGLSIVAVGAALYFASQWGAPDEAPVSGPRP